jgi:8-oxo-dGTP pyrophosphatase MutT (NUDIX family)
VVRLPPPQPVIRAAGGVVVRDGRVLLVHRARYDDWSLPKGKLEAGETWEQAAVREVGEETGVHATVARELGSTHYDVDGEPKEVRWFLMETPDEPRAQTEVDEVRWVPVAYAAGLLSYDGERELLRRL